MSSYKSQVYDQLWVIIEAWAPLSSLFLTGDQTNQQLDGWLRKRLETDVSSFPRIDISTGRYTSTGYTLPGGYTYAVEQTPGYVEAMVGDMIVSRKLEFVIELASQDQSSIDIVEAEDQLQLAFLAAGPCLGLDIINGWGPIDDGNNKYEKINKAARFVSRFTLPVSIMASARDILA